MPTRFAYKRVFSTSGTIVDVVDGVWLAQSISSPGYAASGLQVYLYFNYFEAPETPPPASIPSQLCTVSIRAADENNLPIGDDLASTIFNLSSAVLYAQYQGPPYYPAIYKVVVSISNIELVMSTDYVLCVRPNSQPEFSWIYHTIRFSNSTWTIPPDPEKDEGLSNVGVASRSTDGGVTWSAQAQNSYGINIEVLGNLFLGSYSRHFVNGIRHVYRPGSYREELVFGGMTDDVKTETAKLTIKTTKETGEETVQEVTAPTKVVDEMQQVLENELGAVVDRIKTDKAFLQYGFTTTDVMKWIKQGFTPQQILKMMQSYKGAKVELTKTEPALKKIGLTTGQTMDLLKQQKLQPKDIIQGTDAAVKRAKAFNKYGYSEAEVRAFIKKGWQPGQIVKYMMEHPK